MAVRTGGTRTCAGGCLTRQAPPGAYGGPQLPERDMPPKPASGEVPHSAVVVFNLRAPKDRLSAPGEGAPAATQGAPGMAGPSVDAPQPSAPSAATRLPPRVAKAWAHLPGARPRRSRRCGHAHCRTTDRLRTWVKERRTPLSAFSIPRRLLFPLLAGTCSQWGGCAGSWRLCVTQMRACVSTPSAWARATMASRCAASSCLSRARIQQ